MTIATPIRPKPRPIAPAKAAVPASRRDLIRRVALYCRVSSEDQAERKTIENQLDFLKRYAELHGFAVVDVYADDGVSGTIPLDQREGGKRLLADAAAGKFQTVIFYRLDRLGRALRVLLDAYGALDGMGVALASATEPFDTNSPIGRFVFQLLGSIAELEKETILERTSIGRDRGARAGKWMGGPVPFGYAVTPEGMLEERTEVICALNDEPASEADIVRFIFAELERGSSTIATAALLNSLGVPAHYKYQNRKGELTIRKGDNIWRPNKVRNIVANTTYAGPHFYKGRNGEPIEREYPPLVSEDTWRRANAQMHQNKQLATRNAKRTYLLRGIIRCGGCGHSYAGTASSSKTGERLWIGHYYRCNSQLGAVLADAGQRCRGKRIPMEWLEDTVWADVEEFLRHPSETLDQARRALQEPEPEVDRAAAVATLEAGLRTHRAARDRATDLYVSGRIPLDEYDRKTAEIEAEERILRENLAALQTEELRDQTTADYLQDLEAMLAVAAEKLDAIAADVASGDPEREARAVSARRDLLDLLVERVEVHTTGEGKEKDATIRVALRFRDAVDVSTSMHVCSPGTG